MKERIGEHELSNDDAIDLETVAASLEVDLEDLGNHETITQLLNRHREQLAQDRFNEDEQRTTTRMRQILFYSIYCLSVFIFLTTLAFIGIKLLHNQDLNDSEKAISGGVLGVLVYAIRSIIRFYFHPQLDRREQEESEVQPNKKTKK
jgi:hypothetical protein